MPWTSKMPWDSKAINLTCRIRQKKRIKQIGFSSADDESTQGVSHLVFFSVERTTCIGLIRHSLEIGGKYRHL